MARQAIVGQSSREEKVYPLDYAPSLLEGVTLIDVNLYYSSDNAIDDPPELSLLSIDGTIAYVSVKNLDVGFHRVRCLAVTSNDDLSPEIELLITVKT